MTDIIYLGRTEVHLYFIESGNSWRTAHRLTLLPPVDDLGSVQVVDLCGNGTV